MRKALVALLAMTLVVVGCGQSTSAPIEGSVVLDENLSDTANLVRGNNAFALDLYQALRGEEGNLFFSPYSISIALAMTWAGARGDTEAEMAATLHYLLSQDRLHAAFQSLEQELARRGQGATSDNVEALRLHIVNAQWSQKDYAFLASYLDTLARNYDSEMTPLDFENAAEASRKVINDWVEEQTEGKIKDLIPQGVVKPRTRLVLTNAIYFKAAWFHVFQEALTRDGEFTLLDGNRVTVPMMHQQESFRFFQGEGCQAVELPYEGEELSMVILLPDPGRYEAFELGLDAGRLESIIGRLEHQEISLTMPRFRCESAFSLKKTLEEMGMPLAFSPEEADFSGMTGKLNLCISEVLHKAFVSVNESGLSCSLSATTRPAPSSSWVACWTQRPEGVVNMIRPDGQGGGHEA
jgi:serpin B